MKKTILHFKKIRPFQVIVCLLPITFLSCNGKDGKNGVTPAVIIPAAQCAKNGADLEVIVANNTNTEAFFRGYQDVIPPSVISTPFTVTDIWCVSGESFWGLAEPVIVPSMSTVLVALSCGSIFDDVGPFSNCSVDPGQPIECYTNPFVSTVNQVSHGTQTVSTQYCMPDISNLVDLGVEEIIDIYNSCRQFKENGVVTLDYGICGGQGSSF